MRSFLLPLTFVLATGCGSDGSGGGSPPLAPQKVFADYHVNFQKSSQLMEVTAAFHSNVPNGESMSLASPSQITVNGESMYQVTEDVVATQLNGTFYRQRKTLDDAEGSYTFVWTREDGRQFAQTIDVHGATVEKPAAQDKHSRGKDLYVLISGADVDPMEKVLCQLTSQVKGPRNEIVSAVSRAQGGSACVFTTADLQRFPIGSADLVLFRKGEKDYSFPDAFYSAKVTYSYETDKTTITITE